jgi:hypothetical protein
MKTHKEQFNERHGFKKNSSHSLSTLAQLSKIPIKILEQVYFRGVGAWKTNIKSVREKKTFIKNLDLPRRYKLDKEQWGYGRIYAFINKLQKGVYLNHDIDIAKKIPNIKII